jgi:hypothetical protein
MQLVLPSPTDHENSRGDVPQEPQEGFGEMHYACHLSRGDHA